MASKMISDADKRQMLTVIRENALDFRKALDTSRDEAIALAKSAGYAHFDAIVNSALGLYEGMTEALDNVDETLSQMAELWAKYNVSTDEFGAWIKKYIDDRIPLKTEYETVNFDEGQQQYDSAIHGERLMEEVNKIAARRMSFLEVIQQEHKTHAGDDIADMLVGAWKKFEDICNELVAEFQKTADYRTSLDSRLASVSKGIAELAASMKHVDVQEASKRKIGSVDQSKYLDL